MTLAIAAICPKGIVIGADSRRNIIERSLPVHGTHGSTFCLEGVVGTQDNARKIIRLGKYIGVAIAGLASIGSKSINELIREFREQNNNQQSVNEIAQDLHEYLAPIIERENKGRSNTLPTVEMIVAGYDFPQNSNPRAQGFMISVPTKDENSVVSLSGESGLIGIGSVNLMQRIMFGVDPDLKFIGLEDVNPLSQNLTEEEILSGIQYHVNWQNISLDDAVELVSKIIEMTAFMQRISMRVKDEKEYGGFEHYSPHVGGPVKTAVITPDKGFRWYPVKGKKR